MCILSKSLGYLLGLEFKIYTDCNAIKFALIKKEIIPKFARWVLQIKEFTFEILQRPANRMLHVDNLPRNSISISRERLVMSITEVDWLLSVQVQDMQNSGYYSVKRGRSQ